ncbi:Arginase [Plakobranchus ocellatus]|uniref:Arginase n=1 Tax=Plakobranchus ocellatus TaxID=259542 RepID=A0AAV3Y2I8_9GAST|nr:Arginase [Plakobranchus ocellatus]
MFLRTLGICNYTMDDIEELGIDIAVTKALEQIDPEGKRPIHLSFDVDSLDPDLVPATGTPASPQQGDLRLLGPPSGRGADGGARTRDRRVPADLRADSQATVPPTLPDQVGKKRKQNKT